MKKIAILLLLFFTAQSVFTQAYKITVRVKGLSDTTLLLGHHFGDKQYLIDTSRTDHSGKAVFSGPKPLDGGMYLIAVPSMKNKYFEFLISGNEPEFTLETDTADLVGNMKITGSLENELFYQDLAFVGARRKQMNDLKTRIATVGEDSEEGKLLKEEMKKVNNEVENERSRIINKYPDLFYSKFLHAITDIKIPEAPLNPDGTTDSTFAYYYVYDHYFDNIDFSDARLLRTNVIDARVKKYLRDYVVKAPDSINRAVDAILEKAKADSAIFQYVTVMLLNDYFNSKIMGFDAVYIHIIDHVYKQGKAFWIDDVALYKMIAQADKMRPTLIGMPAPQMILQDTAGNDIPLYGLKSNYTVVVFWDVDCGHCKKEIPKLVDIYTELKNYSGEVYAVYSQEEWTKWEKWLRENKYPWVNVGNKKMNSNFQVDYNVQQTPLILILDKNKKIIAKKISVEQILEIIKEHEAGY